MLNLFLICSYITFLTKAEDQETTFFCLRIETSILFCNTSLEPVDYKKDIQFHGFEWFIRVF